MDVDTFIALQVDTDEAFYQHTWAFEGVFASRVVAERFFLKYFSDYPNMKLFELSLPSSDLPGFMDVMVPAAQDDASSGMYLTALQDLISMPDDQFLGFEVLGVDSWGYMHTSVCYDVRAGFEEAGVRFNDRGYIDTIEGASIGARLNNEFDGGSVGDKYWFPVQIKAILGDYSVQASPLAE